MPNFDPDRTSITSARRYVDYLLSEIGSLPLIPHRCVICYSAALIDRLLARHPHQSHQLGHTNPMQLHFLFPADSPAYGVVRGLHGAPMAAVLLEELIALGFREFLVIGPAGHPAVAPPAELGVGHLLLIDRAWIFEGTSAHYLRQDHSLPDMTTTMRLGELLKGFPFPFRQGAVASTDALYRETRDFVLTLTDREVLAVDMEMSALFSVAEFHGHPIGGVVFISDIVRADGIWELGLSNENFAALTEALATLVQAYTEP